MDSTPTHVPDDLMQQLHAANEHFAEQRRVFDELTEASDFGHEEHIKAATENLRLAEREVEEAEKRIQEFLKHAS